MIQAMPMPSASVTWSRDALIAAGLASSRDAELWLLSAGYDPNIIDDTELPEVIALVKDKQEASSRKYASDCVLVLPLSSGSMALISLDRQDVDIIRPDDQGSLWDMIADRSAKFGSRMKSKTMHVERLREIGATEPDDRALAIDLKRGARRGAERGKGGAAAVLEVSLDDL